MIILTNMVTGASETLEGKLVEFRCNAHGIHISMQKDGKLSFWDRDANWHVNVIEPEQGEIPLTGGRIVSILLDMLSACRACIVKDERDSAQAWYSAFTGLWVHYRSEITDTGLMDMLRTELAHTQGQMQALYKRLTEKHSGAPE